SPRWQQTIKRARETEMGCDHEDDLSADALRMLRDKEASRFARTLNGASRRAHRAGGSGRVGGTDAERSAHVRPRATLAPTAAQAQKASPGQRDRRQTDRYPWQ